MAVVVTVVVVVVDAGDGWSRWGRLGRERCTYFALRADDAVTQCCTAMFSYTA